MEDLQNKFQTGGLVTDQIFPTKTPVPFKGKPRPPMRAASIADRFFNNLTRRIKPLMKVRDAMDKVYSKGYFENHYPEADEELKHVLHSEALEAHARLRATDNSDEHEERKEGLLGGLTININVGK